MYSNVPEGAGLVCPGGMNSPRASVEMEPFPRAALWKASRWWKIRDVSRAAPKESDLILLEGIEGSR